MKHWVRARYTETADRRPKGIQGDHSKEQLGRFNHYENTFLNTIVTRDEIWVHYTVPETKAQSKQWKRAGSPPPKKLKLFPSPGKGCVGCFLGFTWNNIDSFYAKGSNCDF